uniref:alpha-glucosidase n=1 Tax=Bursaphelenchus xylophilus TaxID=6326 RepID=A0A1I7SV42_BURXY
MSDFGDDDPYTVDRGYKTDSYIMAVSGTFVESEEPRTFEEPEFRPRPVMPVTTGKELLLEEPQRDYGALGPDDVEYYRTSSFWRTCRWSCVVCCILLLILLILLTVYSLLIAPRCIEHQHEWWEKAVVYEIWTPSFRDSDADGKGDFIGVAQKLKNIRRLGVSTLYIRPFLSHSDSDGAAVDDFDDVAHDLGNLKEAVDLIEQAHSYGFKVIIDFPVSATSLTHPWFIKSSQASAEENRGFADFYFWKKNYQPNEFISSYGSNGDVYYHIENKPDLAVLNFKEPNVSRSIQKSIFDWIQRGVDGFHLRYVDYLARTQDGKFPNWNGIVKALTDTRKTIRTKIMERDDLRDRKVFFYASMDNIGEMEKLRLGQKAGLDAVLNSELLKIAVGNRICEKTPDSISDCTNEVIGDILQFYQSADDIWPMWQFGDADTERLASRTRSRLQAELLQMVQLLLPGTPIVYYGDMVGAKEVKAMVRVDLLPSVDIPNIPARGANSSSNSNSDGTPPLRILSPPIRQDMFRQRRTRGSPKSDENQ